MKIAAVRIRGRVGKKFDIERTLNLLGMKAKNNCVVLENDSINLGMMNKAKDIITWGEIDAATLAELIRKRGRVGKERVDEKFVKEKVGKDIGSFSKDVVEGKETLGRLGINHVFRLKPPSHGFERGGIRKPFKLGGALGYRGTKINELLKRMI